MDVNKIGAIAADELAKTMERVDEAQIQALMDAICRAKKVFVYGAGRSMLMLRGVAMRLMHLGYDSYVVGDTTTPAFEVDDLLLLGSGSGETGSLVYVATKAKKIGGKIAVMTIKADSTLGKMADYLIEIPAFTIKKEYEDMDKPVLPGGSLFEQSMLLIGDSMVIPLGDRKTIPIDKVFLRHANLE